MPRADAVAREGDGVGDDCAVRVMREVIDSCAVEKGDVVAVLD